MFKRKKYLFMRKISVQEEDIGTNLLSTMLRCMWTKWTNFVWGYTVSYYSLITHMIMININKQVIIRVKNLWWFKTLSLFLRPNPRHAFVETSLNTIKHTHIKWIIIFTHRFSTWLSEHRTPSYIYFLIIYLFVYHLYFFIDRFIPGGLKRTLDWLVVSLLFVVFVY